MISGLKFSPMPEDKHDTSTKVINPIRGRYKSGECTLSLGEVKT